MELGKYIKTILSPVSAKRAKAAKKSGGARKGGGEKFGDIPLRELEKSLGYSFSDKSILREALTHPSAVGAEKGAKSNQRLEFLGDAVLQAAITCAAFKKFPDADEGELTKIRISLTRGSFLAEMSADLGIPKFLDVAKGSESVRQSASAAEDAFEAVVGAIWLDSNFSRAQKTVLSWYKRRVENLPKLVSSQNPKGALQEWAAKAGVAVSYALVSQSGPDHSKTFEVEVSIGGEPAARASASSKKAAESAAAMSALAALSAREEKNSSKQ
ncbi:MAG: ribonuclease III [Opitutales bacterium]|nr:ribonuclease III [Opitutales bacterium]